MSTNNYAGFIEHITSADIHKISANMSHVYMELLNALTMRAMSLDELASDLANDCEIDDKLMDLYTQFCETFKRETGIEIQLAYIDEDCCEINGELEYGANWQLKHTDCYVPSTNFQRLQQKINREIEREFFVTFG